MYSFERILIVDDSPLMRSILKKSLTIAKIGFKEIVECSDGTEVMNLLSDSRFDLMFCDLNMPVMNGDDLIRRLSDWSDSPTPPIVVVSSEASDERVKNLSAKNVIGVIRKPFTPEGLCEVLSRRFSLV